MVVIQKWLHGFGLNIDLSIILSKSLGFLLILILIISPNFPGILNLSCFLVVFYLTGIFLADAQDRPADLLQLFQGKRVMLEGTVVSPARTNSNIRRFELKAESVKPKRKI